MSHSEIHQPALVRYMVAMHSPNEVVVFGKRLPVLSHAESPDGKIHLKCDALALLNEPVGLCEGGALLVNGSAVEASLDITVVPEHTI